MKGFLVIGNREKDAFRSEQKQQLAISNKLPFGTEGNPC